MAAPSSYDFRKSAGRKVRCLLARAYLREGRVGDALDVFQMILGDYPDDEEVLLLLSRLYQIAGQQAAAASLFRRVMKLYPGSQKAELLERSSTIDSGESNPLEGGEEKRAATPEALANLAASLQHNQSVETLQAIRAAAGPQSIVELRDRTHPTAREDVRQLLPALLDLNIRSARTEGRTEMAGALQSLQFQLARRAERADDNQPAGGDLPGTGPVELNDHAE